LVLLVDAEPPQVPKLKAVFVRTAQRQDGRFSLGLWLRNSALRSLFAFLCESLVSETRASAPSLASEILLARLAAWRHLLRGEQLPLTELRGLVGELLVFKSCLAIWSPTEVAQGWLGPLDGPQDFVLPSLRIEVKAVVPDATTVTVTSADQLDVDVRTNLAIVTLASLIPGEEGVTLTGLVEELRDELGSTGALPVLESRLAATGADLSGADAISFRVDEIRFFDVVGDFPRIRRSDLPKGVAGVRYDLHIGACLPYATSLANSP
jgi:hypothetical protein